MTESLDKARENKKKFPLTAGTAIFMSACFLLVMGLCKFSFYVLKNHRSAVSRDEFIQTYVDVQPFAAEKERKTASYIILKDSDASAPAAFFQKKPEKKLTVARARFTGEAAPLPVYKRPPVIRPAVQPVAAPVPESVEASIPDADSLPVSLDALMAEGRDVLDSSDKLFLDSQDLLAEEEAVVAQAEPAPAPPPVPAAKPEPLPVKAEQAVAVAKPQQRQEAILAAAKPATPAKTAERWIDIAALREQLKKEQANASFMDDGAGKVAAAAVHETDSVEPKAAASIKTETPVPAKEAAPVDKKSEPAADKTVAKAPASPFLTKEQIAEQNIFPKSPWKVAKVGGKSVNALAVKNETVKAEAAKGSNAEKQVADAAPSQESAKVIYKNGRAKKIDMPAEGNKPLNWLDRKEAAVWTSLSQSDSPSVWTVGDSRPAETAKAFRVAVEDVPAEQQGSAAIAEKAEISSAPVRTVGKEEKPEAIANPVLLPLGSTVGTPVPAAVKPAEPVAQAAAAPSSAAPAAAPVIPAPTQTVAAPVAENKEDPSLVNKLFSIFNSSGDDSVPTIGGAVPLPEDKKEPAATPAADAASDKKEVKTVVLKADAVPSAAAEKKAEQEILPTEIRLTFKPDGAEISAQSVKWIKAFGLRVKKDIQRAVEVRMSNENIPLQEKRFALIRSTLVGVGVDDAQIVPFMTNRSPHTIILRVFDVPEEGVTEYTTSLDGTKETVYYRKW